MTRATIDAALQTEQQRRHHGMLARREDIIGMELQRGWTQLLEQTSVLESSMPPIRVRPATLVIELEDLLAEWREMWSSNWFGSGQDRLVTSEWTLKDVIAHVASWSAEMNAQAEILAKGSDVAYRILFEKVGGPRTWNAEQVRLRRTHSLETLTLEIERETALLQDLLYKVELPILFFERPIGIASAAAPNDPWLRSIAGMVEMRCFHDRLHISRIRDWQRRNFAGES
jgi:hypothetical protein